MITQNEISSLNLSPTKKDFVQIWNELIEVASKITERWDPTSTNESDPGIVLLKVLTGIADKLNYNIDKNILEAYMPTAAQMESMRKLCELVGYDIRYYQSAETKVRIYYTGNTTDLSKDNDEKLPDTGLALPKFATVTNADKDITFVTTNTLPLLFTNDKPWVDVPCIEGQISQCESVNENNLITLSQLDDNNRYYLPEIQIAENGIFVYSATAQLADGDAWQQVSNLNTQRSGSHVFKFCYDSLEGRPYLLFPDDVGSLIGDGLFIYFVRTSGLSGNISAGALEVLEIPTGDYWEKYSAELFEVVNADATTNGANIESISTAYNNFKKTVGTFDTLVTCRDYMNKIYSLMDANNLPYVSNILVTDIRNDINNAITLCSCNEFGILYKETPLTKTALEASLTRTVKEVYVYDDDGNPVKDENGNLVKVNRLFIEQSDEVEVPLLDHFDLVLYPFKTFTKVFPSTKDLATYYNRSFTYTEQYSSTEDIVGEFEAALADVKTCAHKFVTPEVGDIVAINNYLRLNALIATSNRVSDVEAKQILNNIKVALVNEFNLRNLDFGEEIPFDSILSVIENADSRIKAVSLQEPTVLTTYSVKEGIGSQITSKEYGIASQADIEQDIKNDSHDNTIYGVTYKEEIEESGEKKSVYCKTAKEIYNKLVLRNILAGRASLFEYDNTFVPNNSEKPYTVIKDITDDLKNTTGTAEKINAAIEAILDSLVLPSEQLLCGTDGNIIKDGFYSDNSVLTLRAYNREITLDLVNALADDFSNNHARAEQIQAELNEYNEAGEYVMSTKGFSDGVVTLIVSDIPNTETLDKKVYERILEVYETYEPVFIEKASNSTGAITRTEPVRVVNGIIDNVAKVEATCEISSKNNTFKNITLDKNEVIKFRAPNLITTKTFPAYVYYRFERGTNISSSVTPDGTDGSYAEAMSLTSFINAVDGNKFFPDLWQSASGLEKFTAHIKKDSSGVIDQSNQLTTIFNTAIAIGAHEGAQYKIFTDPTSFFAYLASIKASLLENEEKSIIFEYYPLIAGTMSTWEACIRRHYKSKYGAELPEGTTLWRLSSTTSYPKGKLVTEAGQRLFAQSGEYLANNHAGDTTYLCKNLGTDPVFYSVPKDSDMQLRSGDKLYIHYTPSSTNEDGETVNAEPVSIVYSGDDDEPVIIKPSFELIPSDDVHKQGTSWKKTDVMFPGESSGKNLLSLAPNEQIELRSIQKVVLDTTARFYKNFDNEELERGSSDKIITYELKDGEYLFYTDKSAQGAAYYGSGSVITLDKEAYIPKAPEQVEVSQILEQGLRIVPWGSEVQLSPNKKITITEYQYRTLVEGDTLNTLTLDKDSADADGNYTISSAREISVLDENNKPKRTRAPWIKCLSTKENPIIFTAADAKTPTELPKIDLRLGPSTTWEVCSFLELSTSPNYAQPLRAAAVPQDGSDVAASITNKLKVYVDEGTGISAPIEITPQETVIPASGGQTAFEPVSIKLNTIAQVASGNFEKAESSDESVVDATEVVSNKLQMKVFSEEAPTLVGLSGLGATITPISIKASTSPSVTFKIIPNTANINNYWRALEVSELASTDRYSALNLNFMLPHPDMFGIFSIYLETQKDKLNEESRQNMLRAGARVFIEIPEEFGAAKDIISIYNNQGDNMHSWWSEGVDQSSNRLYLRAGLNCIKIAKSCNILIKAENDANGTLVYDNLRLVKGVEKHGVNLGLIDFKSTSDASTDKQLSEDLLASIAAIDKQHEFYYNAPIENSLAIEFDKNISSFSNPYTLYDVNNINNNFVVSKLDVKYLDTGLRIAKSSKY